MGGMGSLLHSSPWACSWVGGVSGDRGESSALWACESWHTGGDNEDTVQFQLVLAATLPDIGNKKLAMSVGMEF